MQSGVGKLSCNKTALKRCTSTETLWNRKAPSLSSPEDEEIFLPKLPKSWQADVFKGPKVSTAIGAVVLLLLLFIITCSVVCLCVCWCTMPKRMNRSRCRSIGGCALMGPRNHGGHDLPKGRGTLGCSIWACADFSAVNSLNLVRKAAAAMQPLAQIIVATCFLSLSSRERWRYVTSFYYYYYFASAAVAVDSSRATASSSASWSRFSPPSECVRGRMSTSFY